MWTPKGDFMKTAPIFSNNMVLQREKPIRIFGVCGKNHQHTIIVSIPELDVSAKAIITGEKWMAVLPPLKACKSCTVEISYGGEKIIYSNVAVGEVWLAGGQSNMEFELQNDQNGKEALQECAKENVRFYAVPRCEMVDENLKNAEEQSLWQTASYNNSAKWSAVGYYFAKKLSRKLGVTVGIIDCNWGGTSASAWMKREYLAQDSRIRNYIEDYDKAISGKTNGQMIAEYDEYVSYHSKWEKKVQQCYAENPAVKWDEVLKICGENRYPGPMGIKNPMRPCGLYETMISRITPYTLAGFLYYQGESDDHLPETYDVLLKARIENWRSDWLDDELPFLMVQLPMHKYESDPDFKNWPIIREAQMKVFRTVKNTGLAVCLDCGEFNNIHPTNKKEVGNRLYLQSISEVYNLADRTETLPPLFRNAALENGRIRLFFDNCSGFCSDSDKINGFEIAGSDGEFIPADAEIDGDTIILRADFIAPLTAIRYQWTNYAEVNLFGKNGLPVPTFRSSIYLF